jgi:ATP-dependent RNA helicase DBP3
MLVMAPTRELAMQSDVVCKEVAHFALNKSTCIRSVCIYGGVSKSEQKFQIKQGVEIIVATPGRLKDLVDEGCIDLSHVHYLVLDEADRMLDEGFEPVIKAIVSRCPTAEQGRQTIMFSATWPEEIRKLANTYLKNDVIRIVVGGDELSANHRVTQIVECIDKFSKDRKLLEIMNTYYNKLNQNKILVFVLYKREATVVLNNLLVKGYNAGAIHGDKSQQDRTAALEAFKNGSVPILIATDVAARGLDIPQVEYVINFSFPLTVEDYVHRIGRTGRGGATGISHTFFTDDDKTLAGALGM